MTLWKAAFRFRRAPTEGGNPREKPRGEISQVPGQRGRRADGRRRLHRMSRHGPVRCPMAEPPPPTSRRSPARRFTICICALGARMVPFAGYAMPVQYPTGIITEHLHTREQAGLFDVSHMGQAILSRDADRRARRLETLVPGDIVGLGPGGSATRSCSTRLAAFSTT